MKTSSYVYTCTNNNADLISGGQSQSQVMQGGAAFSGRTTKYENTAAVQSLLFMLRRTSDSNVF